MTPYGRILAVVGGSALLALLTTGAIYTQTSLAGATLAAQQTQAVRAAALGDDLVTEVHAQHDALATYLLAGERSSLARFRQAVDEERRTADLIRTEASSLPGLDDVLTTVELENERWRSSVAEPAIAAVQSGSVSDIRAAIRIQVAGLGLTDAATGRFVLGIDQLGEAFSTRYDALEEFRAVVISTGLVIELLAAGLSLWFVRRYGLTVARDASRRASASAERIEIVASLRTVRSQDTPEGTARVIAEGLARLPGIDVAGVYACTADGLVALAVVGIPGFPIRTGETVPEAHARFSSIARGLVHGRSGGQVPPSPARTMIAWRGSGSRAARLHRSCSTASPSA